MNANQIKIDNAAIQAVEDFGRDATQKIPMIKRVRELTNAGLREAKDAVEEALAGRLTERVTLVSEAFTEDEMVVIMDALKLLKAHTNSNIERTFVDRILTKIV